MVNCVSSIMRRQLREPDMVDFIEFVKYETYSGFIQCDEDEKWRNNSSFVH